MKLSKANIPYTLLVSSRDIEVGDTLAADCFTQGGQKVASKGDEIDDKVMRQIQNMGVKKAWIERKVVEWMPEAEAKFQGYERIETHDVSPLHFQILTNFQGAFSTDGIDQLLERITESNLKLEDIDLKDKIETISKKSKRVSRQETRLKEKINELEDENLRERYYQVLSAARPQAVNPSEIKEGKAALGRKIQGFLESLNDLKSELSAIILNMDENRLEALFNLDNLGSYEDTPAFADAFVFFERMFSQTDYEDDDILEELFTTSRNFLAEMFYERNLDENKLETIDTILWENFNPQLPHWFMALGQPGKLKSYLLAHGVNTGILLSQLYLRSDKDPLNETEDLTLACLLKDIGMVLVPHSYHLHEKDLTEEQEQKLKIHPMISREFLEQLAPHHPETLDLVSAHHENIDGSGYPRQIQGLDQDQRLLNICDMFDAMTSPRVWRAAIPPNEAMTYLKDDAGDLIDANWVTHLIKEIGVFPVGTVVRLSNEEPSIVVAQNSSRPDKPQVIPVQELTSENGELTVIDLESDELSIQSGGTSRKAPIAIRKRFRQNDQIVSRFIKSS